MELGPGQVPAVILKGERSGLLTHIATESVSSCVSDEKLAAFVELEAVTQPEWNQQER
jgi:hypothetical protein